MSWEKVLYDLFPSIRVSLLTRIFLDSIVTLIIAVIVVKTVEYITTRMARRNILTQSIAERINRITSLTIYSLTLILILFFITGAREIIYLVLIFAVIFMIYSWYPMINVMSYYAIMLSRYLSVGDPVEIEGIFGKIRDINKLSTVVKTSTGDIVVVPNYKVMVHTLRKRTETRQVRLVMRVRNYGDVSKLEELEKKVRSIIATRFRHGVRMSEPMISLTSLSRDEATYLVGVAIVGYEPRLRPVSELAKLLAASLGEYDVEFHIPFETPEAATSY